MKRTECMQGHKYTKVNTYTRPNGVRVCKTCRNNQKRKAYRERNGGAVGDDRKKFCSKCGNTQIFTLYRPWFISFDEPWAPCNEETETNPCPSDEHLHKICTCGYWWWTRCNGWSHK